MAEVRRSLPTHQHNIHRKPLGFELVESLVTLGIISILLFVVLSTRSLVELQRNVVNQALARQLMVEESEALRNAQFTDLENRTSTQFIEVAYPNGNWAIQNPVNPRSTPNTYTVINVVGGSNPSRQVVPAGNLGDGIFDMAFRIHTGTPGTWKTGFYFRYHDELNHYLLRTSATTLELVRVVEGTSTTLWSSAQSFAVNTWYRLSVNVTGTTLTVSLDGIVQTSPAITDTTFNRGYFVLAAFDDARVDFDDIAFTGSGNLSWNFDSASERIGAIARGWERVGPLSLPSGSTSITITDAQSGFTDLKQISLSVSWQERGSSRSLSNTFYINQQSVAP